MTHAHTADRRIPRTTKSATQHRRSDRRSRRASEHSPSPGLKKINVSAAHIKAMAQDYVQPEPGSLAEHHISHAFVSREFETKSQICAYRLTLSSNFCRIKGSVYQPCPTYYSHLSPFNLLTIAFRLAAFCSSEIVGSFTNFSHGSLSQSPHVSNPRTDLQQEYTGHTSPPAYFSQYTFPFILRQPAHSDGKRAQSEHTAPQGEGITYSSFQYHQGHFEGTGSSALTQYTTALYK